MSNLPQQRLQTIADSTSDLVKTINESVDWVDTYLQGQTNETVSYELKRHRRTLNKVKAAVIQKPTIALFGASQAGKSYLVKNILSDDKNQLLIPDHRNDNVTTNFIQEINPEGGGSEATSLVTRFTFSENTDPLLPPVKIRFLNAKDIILIVLDSYFSDFKKRKINSEMSRTDTEVFLKGLPDFYQTSSQYYLTEDDVYDIEEYLRVSFESAQKTRFGALRDASYWKTIADNIHKIGPDNWTKLFSIIWGNSPELDKLCTLLLSELKKLDFPLELYAEFDAVLRTNGAILNVAILSRLFLNNDHVMVNLVDKSGGKSQINASSLCALSSEVIFNISEESVERNPFIKEIDILDFPGARSRLEQDENDQLTDIQLTNMLLRGKVAYLFNSYSFRYEINNLFICTNNRQSNVNGLSELINNWIEYNIGNTITERTATLSNFNTPPLFIIFTFWNTQMEYDQDNDPKGDLNHKWELRFEKLFKGEIKGTFKWPDEWTNKGRFSNYFLLRDFKYSKDVFNDFESHGVETSLRNERADYYSQLRLSFETSPLTKSFFPNPDLVWENTSVAGKDGSQYIIRHIGNITTNQIRTNRYIQIIENSHQKVRELLNKHYHSDDADNKIIKAAREAAEIHAVMNKIFGRDAFQFGNFIEHFTLKEKDIFESNYEKLRHLEMVEAPALKEYQLYRESSPGLSSEKSFEENLEVLKRDYKRESLADTKEYFEKFLDIDLNELFKGGVHNLKSNSEVLAENARDYWFANVLEVKNFSDIINLGLKEELVSELLEKMKLSFNRYQITRIIAENIRTHVDTLIPVPEAEGMIAHITAGIINEFVTSCGWSFYPPDEKQKIRQTNDINQLGLILPQDEEIFDAMDKLNEGVPGRQSLEQLLEYMANLNEHLNKVPPDMEVIKIIPMVKNYRLWREKMKACFIANCDIPTYNVEANKQLGLILNRISLFDFSLS